MHTPPPTLPGRPGTWAAFRRALLLRCPACGGGPVFLRWLRMAPACATCGLQFGRGEPGYWLGAYFINLLAAETVFAGLFGLVLWWTWPSPPWDLFQAGSVALMLVTPFAFFPWSKTLFLAFDLLFRPRGFEAVERPAAPGA